MKKLIQRLEDYTDIYWFNIQVWDDVNIFVYHKQREYESEVTSIGGHEDFESALIEILKRLDRMNKK